MNPGGEIIVVFPFLETGQKQVAPKMIIQTVRADLGDMVAEFLQRMGAFSGGDGDQRAILNRETGTVLRYCCFIGRFGDCHNPY